VRTLLTVLCFLCSAGVARAQKTDWVWIRNGDRITGEVKSLNHALLKYSTDDLGTIYIEWDNVARISSKATFEVQLRTGVKYYGSLGVVRDGGVVVGLDTLPLAEIVAITPIRRKLLGRLDGYVDVGVSYQKAHSTLQVSSAANVLYRGPRIETRFDVSAYHEGRDDASATSRFNTSLTERLFVANRWSTGFVIGYELNEELDLAGRTRFVGFGSRTLVMSNRTDVRATGGLVLTRERSFSDSTSVSLEGLLGASISKFQYDYPKLDFAFTSQAYPSFTIAGRVRWQNDLRVSYELVKDFTLTWSMFDTFDSKPLSEGAERNDFGTTLAVGWTF
jgi:hypothetical protein